MNALSSSLLPEPETAACEARGLVVAPESGAHRDRWRHLAAGLTVAADAATLLGLVAVAAQLDRVPSRSGLGLVSTLPWLLGTLLARHALERCARACGARGRARVLVSAPTPAGAIAALRYLDPGREEVAGWASHEPMPRLHLFDATPSGLDADVPSVDGVLVIDDEGSPGDVLDRGRRWMGTGKTRIASASFHVLCGRTCPRFADGRGLFPVRRSPLLGPARWAKRATDIAGAAIGLALLAPLLLTIAVAVRVTSPGPVLFRQTRVGKDGAPFTFLKFRSMAAGTPAAPHREYVTTLVREGRPVGRDAKGKPVFKIVDDPRVTRLGRFLRRTSLDELPQLVNVLRGEMSLVGPRPPVPYEWDLHAAWQRPRLDVAPGCTGLWQVTGRSAVSFEDMVVLDLYYIVNWSFVKDLELILRTLPVMACARGGH